MANIHEQLQTISKLGQFNIALVEAGHFYADKPFGPEQEIGIEIGIATIATLKEMGMEATPCILVDDYNAKDSKSPEHLEQAQLLGFVPDVVYREKDFAAPSKRILDILKEKGKTKIRNNSGETYLKQDFIKLVKIDGNLTCALLDAALYQAKHQQFGGICVTVLPDTQDYRTQQRYTKTILKESGQTIPILNIYFTSTGEVSVDFDY